MCAINCLSIAVGRFESYCWSPENVGPTNACVHLALIGADEEPPHEIARRDVRVGASGSIALTAATQVEPAPFKLRRVKTARKVDLLPLHLQGFRRCFCHIHMGCVINACPGAADLHYQRELPGRAERHVAAA